MKHSLILLSFICALTLNSYSQESKINKGEIYSYTFSESKIFPGTERSFQIYIPHGYNDAIPTCLYLGFDGILYNAPAVLDTLIAKKEIPLMIGVFVQPGKICDDDGNVIRYNRSNEFDMIDGRMAEFLEKELLPYISNITLPDNRKINISSDPNDRAISGASSGGIASFTVAWNRPDLFRRVYSTVGTFVAMRGGNELQAIVRKTEPKPLRIFLHDGRNDIWNPLFGHWFEANILLESALSFAGYDVTHVWDDCEHSIKYGTINYPNAMRWLWRDYPQNIKAGVSKNDAYTKIVDPNEQWQEILNEDSIKKHYSNTLSQKSHIVINENIRGNNFTLTNNNIYYIIDNKVCSYNTISKHTIEHNLDIEPGQALAAYPSHKQIAITDKNSNWINTYIIDQKTGELRYGQRYYWLHNINNDISDSPTALAYDTDGNLYAATSLGIQICDQNGRVRLILNSPDAGEISELFFSDIDANLLIIKVNNRVYKRKLPIAGHHTFDSPILPASQGQG